MENEDLKKIISKLIESDKNKDSLDIGTPSKGGNIKVYFDALEVVEAKKKIDNALQLRKYAQMKLELN